MVRGIAENVASDLLLASGACCAVAAALWYFVPKSRPWVAGAAVLIVLGIFVVASRSIRPYDALEGVTVLPSPAVVDGLPLKDEYKRDSNGKLLTAVLAEDFEVQGWPAKGGERISFDPWGGLMSWTASREINVWGRRWSAGTRFEGMMREGDHLTVYPPVGEPVTLTRPKP